MATAFTQDVDVLFSSDFGQTAGAGVNREMLANVLTIIDPTDTPGMAIFSDFDPATAVTVEWPESTLKDPKAVQSSGGANVTSLVGGAPEGADFNALTRPVPSRKSNTLQIFRQDFAVSRTQSRLNTAGIGDKLSHESRLAIKEVLRAIEARLWSVLFSAGFNSGSGGFTEASSRLMKTFEGFLSTNVTSLGSAGNPASPTEDDILDAIMGSMDQGGKITHLMCHHRQKRKLNRLLTGIGGAGAEAPLVRNASNVGVVPGTVRAYESDAGDIQLVGNRWVTRETETVQFDAGSVTEASAVASGGLNEANAAGRVWLIQQDMVAISWLDKPAVVDIAKRGDNISALVVAECTLVVKAEKAHAVLKRVAN